AMMGVVEERLESTLFLERQHLVGNRRLIPFVDKNDVNVFELFFEIGIERRVVPVEMDVEVGIDSAKVIDGFDGDLPLMADQVCQRPCSQLFVGADLVTKTDQCPR